MTRSDANVLDELDGMLEVHDIGVQRSVNSLIE